MNAKRKAGKRQVASAAEMIAHNDAARAQFRAGLGGRLLTAANNAVAKALPNNAAMVDVYRTARAACGVKLTRQQARKEMAEREAANKEREEIHARARAEELTEKKDASARGDVGDSLRGLLAVRDMLLSIKSGDQPFGFDDSRNADVIGTYLMKHAATLERALFQLRVWEGEKFGKKAEAIFSDDLFRIE